MDTDTQAPPTSVKLAYTFGDEMPYPRDTYVVIETVTMDQQRPAAMAIFGFAKHIIDGVEHQGGVNFSFDYPLDEFENGRPGKESQVKRWGYRKAAEFSLLPVRPTLVIDSMSDLQREIVEDLLTKAEKVGTYVEPPTDDELHRLYVEGVVQSIADLHLGNLEAETLKVARDEAERHLPDANGLRGVLGGRAMSAMSDHEFEERLTRIVGDIELAENFSVVIGRDKVSVDPWVDGRFYFQIQCWREDTFTHEFGFGYGGKAYLSPHASDSELVQTVFGLYKGYWEHEARETFKWRKRRVFGPHISTEALWEVARRVDIRKPTSTESKQ